MTVAAHASKNDGVTRWWRGTSLRAKVTGVTVAVLAIGLISAGVGTMAFLRNTLAANLDSQVQQLAHTDAAATVFDIDASDGLAFHTISDATAYFVTIYGPSGELLHVGGGNDAPEPVLPESFALADARVYGPDTVFTLESSSGGAPYRAAVDVGAEPTTGILYTQLVALPTAATERFLASFVGIYSFLAIITVIASAFLVRWIVTLTFRSLGQVEATADAIAGGDFSLRMTDIEPSSTEVGRLKKAINAMLGRIDAALSERDATLRQMRRFIGDASHELRTPLVTVRGYAELYRMGAVTGGDQVAQSMERIEKEAIRMGVLVEDLLALARLDEKRDLVIAPVDLRPIARDAALDARAASPTRDVTVLDTTSLHDEAEGESEPTAEETPSPRRRTPTAAFGFGGARLGRLRRRPRTAESADTAAPAPLGDDAEPIVLGDENRIRQVIANLLGNARRYSPEDSPIELAVGVDRTAAMGWIAVSDHGEGVPPQIRDKIFQRFWRADTSRTRETGGSGLGLSIVASIVEALHGTISVADTPGGGATFRIAFPLAQGRDAAEHADIETQPLTRLTQPDL